MDTAFCKCLRRGATDAGSSAHDYHDFRFGIFLVLISFGSIWRDGFSFLHVQAVVASPTTRHSENFIFWSRKNEWGEYPIRLKRAKSRDVQEVAIPSFFAAVNNAGSAKALVAPAFIFSAVDVTLVSLVVFSTAVFDCLHPVARITLARAARTSDLLFIIFLSVLNLTF